MLQSELDMANKRKKYSAEKKAGVMIKRNLTIIKELIRIPSVGETEVGTAKMQLIRLCLRVGSARDSQLGYQRNVAAAISQTRDCRIS